MSSISTFMPNTLTILKIKYFFKNMYTVHQVINSVFCAMSKSPEEAKPLDPPPTEGKDQEKSVCVTKTSPFYMTVIFPVVN